MAPYGHGRRMHCLRFVCLFAILGESSATLDGIEKVSVMLAAMANATRVVKAIA
jgi:hypothetical protein